jgi:predicted dehydrogenase
MPSMEKLNGCFHGHEPEQKSMTKIAIVGAGYMAVEHARAFAAIDGVKIAGVVGRSPERAQALAADHDCPVYADIETMYADSAADAVVVAVPELACRTVCEKVFEFPWVSLLEKPVGRDYDEARYLNDLCEQSGRTAFVALNRRSYHSTREAHKLLAESEAPRFILVHDTQDLASAREFGQPEEVVKNWMFANSIHLVDYLRQFGRGEIVDVDVPLAFDAENPHSVSATVSFSSGDRAVYFGAWNVPGPWYVTVANEAMRIELRPLEAVSFQRRGERALSPVQACATDTDFKPGLYHQAEQLIQAVKGEKTTLTSLSDATQSMKLVARIYGRV